MKYKKSMGEHIFDCFNALLMLCVFIIMLYPFIYILSYSLSSPSKMTGGLLMIPKGFTLQYYVMVFRIKRILNGIFISVSRTVLVTALMIFFSSMAAYVLSRREVPGRPFFNKFFIFTMYFSGGLIPTYLVFRGLGLTNSYLVYIFPNIISVFNMILIRTYIESLPDELHDAAVVDGANDYVLFFRVLFPLLTPIIATVGLFTAIGQWNSYIDTAIYNPMRQELFSLQYILYSFLSSVQRLTPEDMQSLGTDVMANLISRKGLNMAITVVTILPIACVYPFIRKYFASGLLIGSIKG